jgi:SAM-dependent methyltransferase
VTAGGATCLVCGSARSTSWAVARDIEYHTTTDEFVYRECRDCGVLFIDPVPDQRLSEIYPRNYYSYTRPPASVAARIKAWLDRRFFRSVLRKLARPRLCVLDVGGGAGHELSTLRDADPRIARTQIVDLDPGAEQLAIANGHAYFCGRVEDYETVDRFDLILLLNLIEHVRDPRAVLAKAKQLLAPGGVILLKTPNFRALDARLFRNASWAGLHCPRHWVLFTRDSFTRLVDELGLSVLSSSYTQGAPFWAASTLGWLAARRLARVSRERPVFDHPAYGALAAGFAGLDFLRRPFAKTSQMFFLVGALGPPAEPPSR